ncbi:MAG: ATP-binding protein [Nitrospirae bacterium]|nr:ATP-binding protein [Nitrospirota bacterium]
MYIPQKQLENLTKILQPNKVIVVYGPRRCGKTTLLGEFLKGIDSRYLFVSGEDIAVQNYLSSQSIDKLRSFVGNNRILVIDEAQKISSIGLNLKLIVDHIKNIKVIATGSSSFDLAQNIGEPLTGRKYTLRLFPIAQLELQQIENRSQTAANLENRLIYGYYPEIVLTQDNSQKERYLKEIISSYLYKDVLELEGLRHSGKIIKLLQLIAFQIGREVSYSELGTQLGISKNTVERYLDLLEKTFVVCRLNGFSRNLRKEISKSSRYFFIDNGIRNALLNNFNPLELRDDTGLLWENYLIMERLKKQEYLSITANNYFWRTYDRKEIDLVEERGGHISGYEMKWTKRKENPPKGWLETYSNASYQVIGRDNYLEFIT